MVMVLTLQAGGVGLLLTATSPVVHFDRCWNPSKEVQAADLAHRIGQCRTVVRKLSENSSQQLSLGKTSWFPLFPLKGPVCSSSTLTRDILELFRISEGRRGGVDFGYVCEGLCCGAEASLLWMSSCSKSVN